MHVRSKKDLEIILENVKRFSRPKLELEQYVTDSSIVAELAWFSYMRNEVHNSRVLDLGCGTARFAIAAALLGARAVICLDVDSDAISDARENIYNIGVDSRIDLVLADARYPPFRDNVFNLVFQNPPFGVQSRRGIDIDFLKSAIKVGSKVYTIHKAETVDYVVRKIRELGRNAIIIGRRIINIPLMYKHHRKRIHKVEVVLLYVT
ncbi:MAG: methyltransferase domain-containing protein [Crenarchaeota archaeon]|nr:methyltransferase domain-containing protein [Thermoproteota archaeon]